MKLTYFEDVDTLDIWFGEEEGPVYNTVYGPNESILLYYDEEDRLLSLTVDHASRNLSGASPPVAWLSGCLPGVISFFRHNEFWWLESNLQLKTSAELELAP